MNGQPLIFLAGRRALERIRDNGLAPDDVQVVTGAAGGPKWLVLAHLDVSFGLNGSGIVLYPHFSRRVIPGWFDKHLSWRRPSDENMADVLVIAPSDDFVARLPDGKITDRSDFYTYAGNDAARFACWQQAADAGKRLAEDFMEAVASGSIRRRVAPLDCRPH